MLYFAYGSNLNLRNFKRHAPRATPVSAATLRGYKLVFRQFCDITPDQNPIVGQVDEIEDFFQVSGFMGHGFMMAPVIGKLMAQHIVEQTERGIKLSPYDPKHAKAMAIARRSFRKYADTYKALAK